MVSLSLRIELNRQAFGNLKTGLPFPKIEGGEERKLIG